MIKKQKLPQVYFDGTPIEREVKPQSVKLENYNRTSKLLGEGQISEIFSFLDSLPDFFRYDIKNTQENSYRHCLSYKTIKRIYKRGHLDSDLWIFANPKVLTKMETRFGYRSQWVTVKKENNFVIDLDKFKYASTCEELVAYLKAKGTALPAIIVQTSDRSFHLLYFVKVDTLTREEIRRFAFGLVGAAPDDPLAASEEAFKEKYGLDLNYLRQTHKEHKIRVPGSVNTNHLGPDGKAFVCKHWFNQDLVLLDKFEKAPLVQVPVPLEKKPKRILNRSAQKTYRAFIGDKLSKRMGDKVARFMAYHSGYLAAGNCSISQTAMAAELKMLQPGVCRLLKKLISLGMLKITNGSYNYKPENGKVVCKEYGLGSDLVAFIEEQNASSKERIAKSVESLMEEYVPGERNEMQMRDVRNLRYLNIPIATKVAFLKKKNDDYSRSSRKAYASIRDIEYTIENFDRKALDLAVRNSSVDLASSVVLALKLMNLTED